MNVLVTGSEGFIGRNLCPMLEHAGHEVTRFDVQRGDGDIAVKAPIAQQGQEACIHLAAISGVASCAGIPVDAWQVNTTTVLRICLAFEDRPVIVASSFAAIRDNPSFYGVTKRAAEAITRHFNGSVVRIANVYGPYSQHKASVVHRFVRAALAGDRLPVRDPTAARDFIHVRDVCDAFVAALARPGTDIEAATGRMITLGALADVVTEVADSRPWWRLPNRDPAATWETADRVDLPRGIEDTMAWYSQRQNVETVP